MKRIIPLAENDLKGFQPLHFTWQPCCLKMQHWQPRTRRRYNNRSLFFDLPPGAPMPRPPQTPFCLFFPPRGGPPAPRSLFGKTRGPPAPHTRGPPAPPPHTPPAPRAPPPPPPPPPPAGPAPRPATRLTADLLNDP